MPRKYYRGYRINSIAEFEEKSKISDFFIVGNKTTHKGWIESWQYHYLKIVISKGWLYEAKLINEKGGENEKKDSLCCR